jgi:glycosyltransferase involved in cell wall biosynthesis
MTNHPWKIGIDALPLTEPLTGVGHYTAELARALAATEPSFHYELLYPSTYPAIESDGLPENLPANLQLKRIPVGAIDKHWWSFGLPRYLKSENSSGRPFQVFHGTNFDVPLRRRCATVLTIHDLSQMLHPETHERRRVSRARRRLPLMTRVADAIITPSEGVRREVCDVLKIAAEKVFAVPEAARSTFFPATGEEICSVRSRLGLGENFILAVGTLEPRKNLKVLVEAFEQLSGSENPQLVIAGGKGWLTGPIFERISNSKKRDRIVLTDYLHDDDLRGLYSACAVFIYPSLYEGFGLPPLEAMACGAPVIASDIPPHRETIGKAAKFFDPVNPTELAECVGSLISNDKERATLSLAGRRRAAEFHWEDTARHTLRVYEEAHRRFHSLKK